MSDKKSRNWNVDATACGGEGQNMDCNLFSTHKGFGQLDIVSKTLVCGCVLYPEPEEEVFDESTWLTKQ